MKNTMWAAGILFAGWSAVPPAKAGTITLPAGSTLRVILETTLTTKESKVGDPFRSRLVIPVFVNQREAIPLGSVVEGTVVNLKAPGRVKGKAQMQLRPEKLTLPDGRTFSLMASLTDVQTGADIEVDPKEGTISGSGKEGLNAKKVATGAAASAGIGAVMGGGQGAAIGAGAVGAVALLHHLLKRGKDADLPAGSEIVLELSRPVEIPLMEEVGQPAKTGLRRSSSAERVAP